MNFNFDPFEPYDPEKVRENIRRMKEEIERIEAETERLRNDPNYYLGKKEEEEQPSKNAKKTKELYEKLRRAVYPERNFIIDAYGKIISWIYYFLAIVPRNLSIYLHQERIIVFAAKNEPKTLIEAAYRSFLLAYVVLILIIIILIIKKLGILSIHIFKYIFKKLTKKKEGEKFSILTKTIFFIFLRIIVFLTLDTWWYYVYMKKILIIKICLMHEILKYQTMQKSILFEKVNYSMNIFLKFSFYTVLLTIFLITIISLGERKNILKVWTSSETMKPTYILILKLFIKYAIFSVFFFLFSLFENLFILINAGHYIFLTKETLKNIY